MRRGVTKVSLKKNCTIAQLTSFNMIYDLIQFSGGGGPPKSKISCIIPSNMILIQDNLQKSVCLHCKSEIFFMPEFLQLL